MPEECNDAPESAEQLRANTLKFVAETRDRLSQILSRLNWTVDGVLKQHHGEHAQNENLAKDAASPEADCDKGFPPAYPNDNVLKLHDSELGLKYEGLELSSFNDLQVNLTSAQRLQRYDVFIEHAKKLQPPQRLPTFGGDNVGVVAEVNNLADIVAQKKKERKKQRRHRINRPTYNEELREVVELHMQALQQFIKAKQPHKFRSSSVNLDSDQRQRKCAKRSRSSSSTRRQTLTPKGDSKRERSHAEKSERKDKQKRTRDDEHYIRDRNYKRKLSPETNNCSTDRRQRSRKKKSKEDYSEERKISRRKRTDRSRSPEERHKKKSKSSKERLYREQSCREVGSRTSNQQNTKYRDERDHHQSRSHAETYRDNKY